MEKQLAAYYRSTDQAVAELEAEKFVKADALQAFYANHTSRVRDFQHERLIHLLVTLFFGFLFLVALGAFFLILSLPIAADPLLSGLAAILATLLLATEVFYIRHYYQLENGVQRLYTLTERLAALIA